MIKRRALSRPLSILLFSAFTLLASTVSAQTPIAFPYTMTTLAGGLVPTSYTANTTLCPGSSTIKTATTAGDNCPAVAATLGAGGRGGVAVDSLGNVFVADDISKAIHMIDPTTGVMTLVAGLGTVCGSSSGKLSSAGDGCLAATQTVLGSPRGIGLDAYGNVLIPEYSQNVIHIVCRNASPLCTAGTPAPTTGNPIQVQIGYMGLVGGCVAGSGGTGTSGTGYDGQPGFSTYNSALTNTASYPATLSGSASAFKNAGSCTASLGELAAPRAAWGDIYGNVYVADTTTSRTRVILGPYTSSYFKGNNPLYAALAVNTNWTWTGTVSTSTLKPGYVYTVANVSGVSGSYNTTATVAVGSACLKTITANTVTYANSSISATALDTHADGCPYFDSSISASSGYTNTTVTDAAGNLIFTDPNSSGGLLRVFFVQGWANSSAAASAGANGATATAGVAMYNAIVRANPGVTPKAGYIYALAGGVAAGQTGFTSTPLSTSPTAGNATVLNSSSINKVAISPQGNIYIGNGSSVLFFDINSGTIRTLISSGAATSITKGSYCSGSSGAIARSPYFDGCPANQAYWGNGNALSVAVDAQGNLYLYDTLGYPSGTLVRKVLAQGTGTQPRATLAALATVTTAQPLNALGTGQPQIFAVHFPVATAATATATVSANFTASTPQCSLNAADNSVDCTVTVTNTPAAAGALGGSLTVQVAGGATATLNLNGTVAGSVLAIDQLTSAGSVVQTSAALFSGQSANAVAVDNAGNVFAVVGSSGSYSIVKSVAGSASSNVSIASGLTAKPTSLVIDAAGDIFYLNGSSQIQELVNTATGAPNTYSATTVSYVPVGLGTANPVALAVDANGNLLVADNQSGTSTLYRISLAATSQYLQSQCQYASSNSTLPTLCQAVLYGNVSGSYAPLTAGVVNALAIDAAGNIYAADSTNTKVWQLTPGIDSTLKIWDYTASTLLGSTTAYGLATDPAGNLYVQTASGITMYPQSGPTSAGVSVFTGGSSPSGVAVDGVGNVYVADSAVSSVTQIQRNSFAVGFASDYTKVVTAQLTNVGSQAAAAQSSANGVNAGAFTLTGTSYACTFTNNLLNAMTAGQSCSLTAQFPAIGNGPDTDTIAFTPVVPSSTAIGSLLLTGVANQKGYTTTTTIGGASPASPVYVASGTEVSFPISVTANSTSTDGTITNNAVGPTTSNYVLISVDGATATSYPFTSASGLTASLTLNLSGLTATAHTFTVSFPQQGSFLPSTASSGSFSVSPTGTSVSWTPTTTTQPVSAALGTGVLNATVTPAIAGNFAYALGGTPSCTGTTTSTTPIDASTYLPIGNYTLYARFCPTDTVDYTSSTASISGYSVTQATSTAAVGASTMVVAPSGANFTTLTAALQALPVSGGTIYIAPGTYTGQNAVSYPNVQLRGLGGDPSQVILSGQNGAFSAGAQPTYTPNGGTLSTYTLGPAGKGGDEGAATLDVSKNGYMGLAAAASGYTPNNFYAEYLTIQNTYNTDSSTTSTWTATSNGGTCSSGGSAQTLQYLYNNNQQCGSQALALFLNSDGAVLNNVNLLSQQDTLYASSIGCGTYCTVAREYMWKGLISGNVDYTFGDAALVFDHTNFFTTWHGLVATNNETITAQNKRYATGSTNGVPNSTIANNTDYLSGFVCNGCNLLSQSTGMTKLYYGRPWNISTSSYPSSYSTWVMLNSYVDQINPSGWIGWDGASQYLNTSTYGEFNTMALTDPTPGTYPYPAAIYNSTPSVLYNANVGNATAGSLVPVGGNTGSYGVTASSTTPANRETYSLALNAATAAPWYPVAFLSTTVPSTKLSSGQAANWNPVAALAAQVNGFVPVSSVGAIANGGSVTILGRPQTPGAGMIPTGTYAFYDSLNTNQVCSVAGGNCTLLASGALDAAGEAYLTTSSLASGTHYVTMVYGGDTNFSASTSSTYSIYVLNPGQVSTTTTLAVANTSSTTGTAISGTVTLTPTTADGTVSVYLDGVAATSCTLSSGVCSWSIAAPTAGSHSMYAYYAGDAAYGHSTSSNVNLFVSAPVATGDSRTVTEPTIPAVCQQLTATLATNPATQDLDTSVDATVTNPDGVRIQAALNACSATAVAQNTQLSVELSMDAAGANNAFLTGPISMPSNVTLLVDPNVTLYFSRNVQDYDKVSGTNTCGTINNGSNTGSCKPLIDILKTSTNVGIMGYGKLNGRGGDLLLNSFTTSGFAMPATPTWWNLASQANGEGNQMNPRFILIEGGASNVTLYKITILNSPNFHVSMSGGATNVTAWGVKIVTPTAARNTDGIDPGDAQNVTVAYSWISDGDDNVAVGAPHNQAKNISVIHNHFFAGHGESIGSYTNGGVANILFDDNMSVGNAFAGHGSAVDANGLFSASGVADTNSTAVRIKTANDRGSLVTGIQYSNSCFLDHKADVQFTPYYSSGDSTNAIPNYNGIFLQNLVFLNDASSSGTVELTGEYNTNDGNPITNPLTITMDNVTFPSALSSLVNSTAPVESTAVWANGNYSGGTGQYVNLTIGPGNVSSNFLTAYNTVAANPVNYNTLTNNVSLTTLNPPVCVFTFLAPELTGPNNLPQTVPYGSTANVDVILTPAVGGAAYPTGSVTVTDTTTSNTFTGTLSGTGDTLIMTIPASDLTLGTHNFTATYLGNSNYTIPARYQTFGNYQVTVVQATPVITWNPAAASITYGTTLAGLLNATASVPGVFSYKATPAAGGNAVAVTNSTILAAGSYTLAASFVPTDTVNYTNATASVTLTVNKATPVLSWTAPAAINYGTTLASSLTPAAAFGGSAVTGSFTYTAVPAAGGTSVTVTSATVLTVGNWTLTATFTPTDTTDYVTGGTTSTTLSVGQIIPTVAVSSSAAMAVLQNSVTLSATVSSTVSTPTGSVNFMDGTTVLATVALSAGKATYSTSALALGVHNLSVAYLGDTNFKTATSSTTPVTVITVSIGNAGPGGGSTGTGSGNTQIILPGGTASYALPILPNSGSSFPIALTLSVSGLPTGATASVTPSSWVTQSNASSWILPANTALNGSTLLSISVPSATAKNEPVEHPMLKHTAPLALALLLLPFAARFRRSAKRMARFTALLLLLASGVAAAAGLTGCGSSGFFAQKQVNYTLTVTVTAGSLQQTTNLNLTVE